jgi:uncharacterized membrane protein
MAKGHVETDQTGRSGTPAAIPLRPALFARLRAYFFAGVLVTAPIGITVYLAWSVVSWIDQSILPLLPAQYNPETYLPFSLPGIGLVVLLLFLTAIGAITAGMVGRMVVGYGERILNRMPIIRSVYSATKQIFETMLAQKANAFREVALIEYPRKGIWTLAFITGTTSGDVRARFDEEMVNVFVPTTPNPTSGFLLFLPRRDVHVLDMNVEDGIKMVVSTGIITPPEKTGLSPTAEF